MKKGVSIMALAIYIAGFIIILGILVSFNINVMNKMENFTAKNILNSEYVKFNMFITILCKENNYIEKNADDEIIIKKYEKELQTIYETDEDSGEDYISEQYWENDSGKIVGKIVYDSTNKEVYYYKYDEESNEYDTDGKILMCKYVSIAEFDINDNHNIETHLGYEYRNINFQPNDVTYIMGRGI